MSEYRNRPVALLTRHGKERVIAPAFRDVLGAQIVHTDAFDTDLFGTFTGEIAREGTQRDAARRKAEQGMALTGLPLGVANEGSFGPSPFGFGSWNVEIALFLDRERGIEVAGVAQGPASDRSVCARTGHDVDAFAASVGFPAQGIVVRGADGSLAKDVRDVDALRGAFSRARAHGDVTLETDLRAHANPTRMARIAEAALDLARRLATPCPECAAPGFGPQRVETGLPCCACATPSSLTRAVISCCVACAAESRTAADEPCADPTWCPRCNP
jgi:hypothetical protein